MILNVQTGLLLTSWRSCRSFRPAQIRGKVEPAGHDVMIGGLSQDWLTQIWLREKGNSSRKSYAGKSHIALESPRLDVPNAWVRLIADRPKTR